MANEQLDDLHLSMGEFLTTCAHLENMLWGLMLICESDKRSLEDKTKQFLLLTFGQRVDLLDKLRQANSFSSDQKTVLDGAFEKLRPMVQKRNLIVHGTTYEIGFSNEDVAPYRIGAPKGNLAYMEQFRHLARDRFEGDVRKNHASTEHAGHRVRHGWLLDSPIGGNRLFQYPAQLAICAAKSNAGDGGLEPRTLDATPTIDLSDLV